MIICARVTHRDGRTTRDYQETASLNEAQHTASHIARHLWKQDSVKAFEITIASVLVRPYYCPDKDTSPPPWKEED